MNGAEIIAIKLGLPVVAAVSIVAQAAVPSGDPATWVGVGGQAVAWSVVVYFAQALLNGKMAVRNITEQIARLEALVAEGARREAALHEVVADGARREDSLLAALNARGGTSHVRRPAND